MSKLSSFPTLIPSLQTLKILELLEELRLNNEIENDEDYNDKLRDLLGEIKADNFVPLTKRLLKLRPGLSSSGQMNFQFDTIRRDLEVIALELANINTVIKSHKEVFKDQYQDQIDFMITDLEAKLLSLRSVQDLSSGHNDVIYNTFSDLSQLLSQNDPLAPDLYQDLRKFMFIIGSDIASISKPEQALALSIDSYNEIEFANVDLDRTNTTPTEQDIDLSDSRPQNILDNQTGTYWYYNVLSKSVLDGGAHLTLVFDIGDKKSINFLILESIANFPLQISSIDYIDEFGSIKELPVDLTDSKLSGRRKFSFKTLVANKIIVLLKQLNFSYFTYDKNYPPVTLEDLKRNSSLDKKTLLLSKNIKDLIGDSDVLDILPLEEDQEAEYEVFYHYTFGLDNALAGLDQYLDNGFFVSKANKLSKVGRLALEVEENIPEYFDEVLLESYPIGSFEYDLVKRDFSTKGDLIGTKTIPILPIGATSISNERLFFTPTRRIITLRFPGHTVELDASTVELFRNNIPLVIGTDWRFANRSNPGDDTDTILLTGETTTEIEVLHLDNVISNGIYTANYIPQHLLDPLEEVYLDVNETILYLSNNGVEFKIDKIFEVPEYSDLFLKIAIRNNSFVHFLSPKLDFYKLFFSNTI